MKNTFIVLTVFLVASTLLAQKLKQNNDSIIVAAIFKGHVGAFVMYDKQKQKYFRFNQARCAERFLPASTFKIPNSLIGLESGIITDENFVIKWDGMRRWNDEWNKDHTLASAIKYSVVPYYQELARRVGRESYKKYLNEIDYGNKTAGENIDTFWLDNSLKISADEQVEFLKSLSDYKLPFSRRNVEIIKKIIPEEKYSNSVLKFKTGTGTKADKTYIGWLVGYVEKGENVFFYAFNIEAKTFEEVSGLRDNASRKILKELKIIE